MARRRKFYTELRKVLRAADVIVEAHRKGILSSRKEREDKVESDIRVSYKSISYITYIPTYLLSYLLAYLLIC